MRPNAARAITRRPLFFLQTRSVRLNGSVEGRCYRHRCTGPNRFQIQTSDSEWAECPAGGAIQVTNMSGFWFFCWFISHSTITIPPSLPPQIEGYDGTVFCPDRRLCLRGDLPPPSEDASAFPAAITGQVRLGAACTFCQHHQ